MDTLLRDERSSIPIDYQNAVTTSIPLWQSQVLNHIRNETYRYNWGLQGNVCFEIPTEPAQASELTQRFNSRVSQVQDHLSAIFPEDLMTLRLNFSNKDVLESYDWKSQLGSRPDGEKLAQHIYHECEEAGWAGNITIDFDSPYDDPPTPGVRHFHHVLRAAYQKGRNLLLVIDGYGRQAIEQGFLMYQGVPQPDRDEYRQVLIRSAEGQERLDSGYGSPWTSAQWDWVNSSSKPEAFSARPPCFDELRFNAFVGTIAIAIGSLQKGKQVAIRFPYRFGKTTMLRALAKLDLPGITIGEISSADGITLINLRNGKKLERAINGSDDQLIIVNEAGREHAEETIAKLEGANIKVLRIYPTDGIPPDGYELIEQE